MSSQGVCSDFSLNLTAVITSVRDGDVTVLTTGGNKLPFGGFDPVRHRTLELALRGWVREQTGLELGYVEQLYTFGNRHRDPEFAAGRNHQITVGYLALVPSGASVHTNLASWVPWYRFLPWEDHRGGRPEVLDGLLLPALEEWISEAETVTQRQSRRERLVTAFGDGRVPWDTERTILRYELLYEAGVVEESARDWLAYPEVERDQLPISKGGMAKPSSGCLALGIAMKQDHRRILASSIGRMRGKLKYRPVVFELLPEMFTLLDLQKVVEALSGVRLHKQNFRRLMIQGSLLKPTGEKSTEGPGRPAELFRFRRGILAERPAPNPSEP